jgi:hypothetical protein
MVHSLTPEHLALSNGVITDRLNQARFVVSTRARYRNESGKHMLVSSFSYFDPKQNLRSKPLDYEPIREECHC